MSILKKLLKITKNIKIPVALAILLVASVYIASANLDGWQYHKNIIIKENSGNTLTDYQILINLSGADFPNESQPDGSDIRFTNISGNLLSYWIEDYNATTKTAKIWVKVPRIPANGTTTLQMHYGNASASAMSNGTATFEFFDDFEDGDYTDKWVSYSCDNGYISETNGYLRLIGQGNNLGKPYARSKNQISEKNIRMDYRGRIENTLGEMKGLIHWDGLGAGVYCQTNNGFTNNFYNDAGSGGNNLIEAVNGVRTSLNFSSESADTSWHSYSISYFNGNLSITTKNGATLTATSSTNFTTLYVGFAGRSVYSNSRVDDVRVRTYTSIEPTVKIENVSESWLMLSTDKKNYSLGENIVLSIVVNYTGNPVFVQFKLELQEPYGANPDTLIKTGFIPLTAGVYKKVSLNYPIPVSPLISEGDYTFKMYAIDGLGNIIASNATSFYINDSMPSSLVREFI